MMFTEKVDYPKEAFYCVCSVCGDILNPIWFTEKQRLVNKEGNLYYTGKRRISCSHLECVTCGHKEIVDDSFDGPWK